MQLAVVAVFCQVSQNLPCHRNIDHFLGPFRTCLEQQNFFWRLLPKSLFSAVSCIRRALLPDDSIATIHHLGV